MARALAGVFAVVFAPPSASRAIAQEYRDIAGEAGLTLVTGTGGREKNHIAESTGTGVAVLDYDQDGLPDLYFPNAPSWNDPEGAWQVRSGVLYRNIGGRQFSDVTEAAGLVTEVYGQGAVSADFDGDGFPDLYVTALGPNLLFRNNGDGTFSEIGERAGVADPGWTIGAAFLDADGDRAADLFVANYIRFGKRFALGDVPLKLDAYLYNALNSTASIWNSSLRLADPGEDFIPSRWVEPRRLMLLAGFVF